MLSPGHPQARRVRHLLTAASTAMTGLELLIGDIRLDVTLHRAHGPSLA